MKKVSKPFLQIALILVTLQIGCAERSAETSRKSVEENQKVAKSRSMDSEAQSASSVEKNASTRTALMYARECEKHLGPFPKFRYEDALEIPITQNGKRVIVTAENIGKNLRSGDKPAAFGAPYQLGNRVGRYQGLKADGSPNPDVVFVTFFRDGGLGVIGHNMKTGATCFLSVNDEFDLKQGLPTPGEPEYDEAWQPPSVVGRRWVREVPYGRSVFAFTMDRSSA